jgi:hypothetical protein
MSNPLYVDASQLPSTSQAIVLNSGTVAQPSNVTKADRFWASARAPIGDSTAEVLEIDFATAGLVNRLAFDFVRFPQTINVEYTRDTGSNWQPVLDALTGLPVVVSVLESFPSVLPSPNAVSGHRHPQHDYDGHWVRQGFEIAPDEIQKLRFVITRNPAGNPPVDVTGAPVPFSVALQNIEAGYEIRSKDDIPRSILEADSKQTTETFANSVDLFNSNLGFAQRTRYANNLLFNTDDYAPYVWKSEPQPFPSAVVNFYADLRDSDGNPQTIDRIFLDPLFEGPFINLYYSNQTSVDEFESSRVSLDSTQALVVNGSIDQVQQRMNLGTFVNPYQLNIQAKASMFVVGTTGTEDPAQLPTATGTDVQFAKSYAQISNSAISFDASKDWWLGMSFLPTGDPLAATSNFFYPLFSCSQFEIGYYNAIDSISGVLTAYAYLKTVYGDLDSTPIYTDGVQPNISEIQLVAASYDGKLHLSVARHGVTQTVDINASVAFSDVLPDVLIVGADPKLERFTNPSISALILKQETWTDDNFIANPTGYSHVARFPTQTEFGGKNALVRFDPSLISLNAPSGLVGGPAFTFENLTWTPIPRTYAMHRGAMILPATKARFWNLEISNLRPEINDKFVPVTRTVKTFPDEVLTQFNNLVTDVARQSYDDLGSNVQSQLAYTISYRDIPLFTGTGADTQSFSDTEVYVAQDPSTADRLQNLGTEWTYRQWHPDVRIPRFTSVSQHNYTEKPYQQTSNVSFYCGLRNIQFQRTTNSVPQDQAIIEEDFLDSSALDPNGGWIINEQTGSLSSGGSTYARSTSVTMPTQRGVRAVQFATQQSDAKQINLNGDFSSSTYDPDNLTSWSRFGDGKMLGLTEVNNATDVALLVSRQYQNGFWADVAINYTADPVFTSFLAGSYGAITKYDPAGVPLTHTLAGYSTTYADLSKGSQFSEYVGGIASEAVPVPNGGRLYAAARVTTTDTLDQPLWLQLVDAETGGVLSEQEMNVTKGQIQQWYTAIDTGVFQINGTRWGDLDSLPTYPTFNDTFARPDASSLGNMTPSGQAWVTVGTSHHIVSNKAVTNLTGDRSQFDTKTPWGKWTISFPNLPTTTGKLLDLGGIILQGNGTLYSTITSSSIGTVTLAAGNTYTFEFIPTAAVSPGDTAMELPYTLRVYTNGTLNSTFNMAHSFTTTRALLGDATQQFDDLIWIPGTAEVEIYNQMETLPVPSTNDLVSAGSNIWTWAQPIFGPLASDKPRYRNWLFQGQFTYGTAQYCNNIQALAPGGSFVAAPTGLAVVANPAPGSSAPLSTPTFSAYASMFDAPTTTYFWKVTAVNEVGESTGSTEVSATVQSGGSATLTWTKSAGATKYNVYRSTTTGTETMIAKLGDVSSFVDTLATPATVGPIVPSSNTTAAYGTVAVADMMDQYGTLELNVTTMPSGVSNTAVPIAYLNYNLASGSIITLYGDGTIRDQNSNTLATIAAFTPTAGRLLIRYLPAQLFSPSFKTTWGITGTDTQAIVIMQGTTVKAVLHGTAVWDSTIRGVGGAASGTGAGQYSVIEGPGWAPEGAILSTNLTQVTWLNVTDNNTAHFGLLSGFSSDNGTVQVRLIQKTPTNDFWFVQAIGLFWDPILWEFTCDDGLTWWPALDVRNDPNAVLQFPGNLTNYGYLKWRVTSFSPDMHITHVAIRPWYSGSSAYDEVPRPTQLPLGPNLTPSDYYARIENDPRWGGWSKPIPRWWWNAYKIQN